LQALFGVTAGGIIPSANALVADVTRPEQRGVVYGLMAGAASLGGFFGPLIGSGLAATLGFSATFLATGGILLLLAAGIALGGPRGRPTADANLASGVGSGP
ncbi:MAG: MFS transporter, partial [Chloroflexota bacterium]|nr:MFS transporter [Chloroflexota bacterium]